MSRVMLLAADNPLPLCDRQEVCTTTAVHHGQRISVTHLAGFLVEEHRYYASAVDALALPIKPYRYELQLEATQTDLHHLRQYLSSNFSPGETVELWNLWVGNGEEIRPPHYTGRLADFDLDTLEQFCAPGTDGLSDHCRFTITC